MKFATDFKEGSTVSLVCDIYFFMPQGTVYIMKLTSAVRLNIQKVLQNPQMKAAVELEINIIPVTQDYFTPGFFMCFMFF